MTASRPSAPTADRTGHPADPARGPARSGTDAGAGLIERLARLDRRVERERTARLDAERIAEEGMRALWEANRDLENRVAERTAELERSLLVAKAATAARERFLCELGHDLATPLHNVLGLLELIDTSELADLDRVRLFDAETHATHLADRLRGLVDLAAADSPSTEDDLHERDAGRWLDAAVESWTRPAARRAQLLAPSVRGPLEPTRGDWGRLRRALDAVLANVVAHAGPGVVEITVDDDASDVVRIVVTDQGPGIPDEIASSVSEPFVAAGPTGGAGLGLAVVDRSIRSAGGQFSIDGTGGRTTVRFSLPVV